VRPQRQRVLELGRDRQPRARDDRADGGAVEPLHVTDLGRVRALARAPRRQVGLERHLHDHRLTCAGHLREQRRGVGHVLEHV
jgi:hypothetical protein